MKEATAVKRPLAIAEIELEATITARAGDRAKGYEMFRKAAEMEAALIYTEPPSYPRPVVEGLGATAPRWAITRSPRSAYREALAREPGSGRAYFAPATALSGLGRDADARQMAARGIKAWDKADADLPQLRTTGSTAGGHPIGPPDHQAAGGKTPSPRRLRQAGLRDQ